MLGIEPRAARWAWTVSLVLLAIYAAYLVRGTACVFLLALFLSYVVDPLVDACARHLLPRRSRAASTVLVFVLLLAALAGVVALVGPAVADQSATLGEQWRRWAADPQLLQRLPLPGWLEPFRDRLLALIRSHLDGGGEMLLPAVQRIGQGLLQAAGGAVLLLLVPVLAFLIVKDAPALRRRAVVWVARRRHAAMWQAILADLDRLLGRYMRALMLLSLAATMAYALVFTLAGVPFALVLALAAGVLEFVPVVGPALAALGVLGVAGLSGYEHLLALALFLGVYRVLQDYLLSPWLMSGGASLSPMLVLLGLLAGGDLGGVAGVFLSVPAIAAARVLAMHLLRETGH